MKLPLPLPLTRVLLSGFLSVTMAALMASPAAGLDLEAGQLVRSGGAVIDVPGYSVPAMADMTGDGLEDLIVGQGDGSNLGKVRIYTNVGAAGAPAFDGYFFAQSAGNDLALTGSGCLGAAPRGFDWDADGLTDLIVGTADGRVLFYENTGTPGAPAFAAASPVRAGPAGGQTDINVASRALPALRDWDGDGDTDLIVGAYDAYIRVYLNNGMTPSGPQLLGELRATSGGGDLIVPGQRAAPDFVDLDGDGVADLLAGNTNGQLLLYVNIGTATDPAFAGYTYVTSEGVAIDLPGSARSRPFVTDWNADGIPDLLVGADDGQVHLYQGVPEPMTGMFLLVGAALLRRRKRNRKEPSITPRFRWGAIVRTQGEILP